MLYSTHSENNIEEHIIFYVDDDPDDRHLLTNALNAINSNYKIIEVENGADALVALKQLKEKGTLPSLIVLDINMPKVDGKQAYVSIRSDEVLSAIPVIIFSTSKSEMDKLFFKRKNTEYITKPSDYDRIEEVAAKMLSYCSST